MYPAYPEPARPSRPAPPPLTKRLRTVHWVALDCMAATLAAISVAATARSHFPAPAPVPAAAALAPVPALGSAHLTASGHGLLVVYLLLAAGAFIPVALRRYAPVLAFGSLITLAAVLLSATEGASAALFLASAYVLYTVTVTSKRRRTGFAALALGISVMFLSIIVNQQAESALKAGVFVPVAFAMVIAWILGYSVRQRRLYIVTLQQQAASSAVAEERLRIARELHDVVAHSMSVIAVQAGYGQYVIDASPQGAREALDAIQATSRDALDEMRRMLGVLRQQDSPGGPGAASPGATPAPGSDGASRSGADQGGASRSGATPSGVDVGVAGPDNVADPDNVATTATAGRRLDAGPQHSPAPPAPAPLAPAPGLGDLGRLIERTGGAGITVSLEISGTPRPVPASVDLSAYRIIQEALTNVVKHAGGGAACAVSVRYTDAELVIRVTDDGGEDLVLSPAGLAPKASPVAGGHGIIGMRERAVLCGGQFSAGPRGNGGWHVSAMLPLRTPATAEI